MGKRYILAIALSFLVLLSWSALVKKPYTIADKAVAAKEMVTSPPVKQDIIPDKAGQEFPVADLTTLEYSSGNEKYIFTEQNAALQEIIFNGHLQYKFPLRYGFMIDEPSLKFKTMSTLNKEMSNSRNVMSNSNRVMSTLNKEMSNLDNEIGFVHFDQSKKIAKDFIFSGGYDSWLRINVQNVSSETITLSLPIILGVLDFSANNMNSRYLGAVVKTPDKTFHVNGRKDTFYDGVEFIALRDRYFCALIEPESKGCSAFIRRLNGKESEIGLTCEKIVLGPGQEIGQKFHIYIGPQDVSVLSKVKAAWAGVIHYGMFDFISQIILKLLEFFYGIVHNWGWAIIILSIVIYILLFPLTLKQMHSMKEMQALQPRIEELRKTYKDNPQKLNKEIMELYREHKVNPFGGCLPLILQMPIFFGLYQALMRSVALRGANFLWIKDLSEPDRLFILPNSLPILGSEINILPIIMAIGMFFQQKLSMVSGSGGSAEQQKMMLIIFPVMFGLIFYHMPSGLVLYWFINSTLMTAYQFYIRRAK